MKNCFEAFRLPAAFLAGAGLVLALAAGPPPPLRRPPGKARSRPPRTPASSSTTPRSACSTSRSRPAGPQWVQSNFITYDTQILAAQRNEVLHRRGRRARQAGRPVSTTSSSPPTCAARWTCSSAAWCCRRPPIPKKNAELTRLAASLDAQYGSGKYCPPGGGECKSLPERRGHHDATAAIPRSCWTPGRAGTRSRRRCAPTTQRLVEIANEGSRELGYKDTGALWRSKYDMPPDAFAAELDRLWGQVKPLYDALHCYVRARLNEKYGDAVRAARPARSRRTCWATCGRRSGATSTTWSRRPDADPGYDLTKLLRGQEGSTPMEMVKYGEGFFTSLGFAPLPETFWERSLFTKPQDRDVVCHASAWDIDDKDDLRIKMCIKVNDEDFLTIHHELGHNFYQRAYNKQPFLFQDSANDGFHEAIGDTIALSITPDLPEADRPARHRCPDAGEGHRPAC